MRLVDRGLLDDRVSQLSAPLAGGAVGASQSRVERLDLASLLPGVELGMEVIEENEAVVVAGQRQVDGRGGGVRGGHDFSLVGEFRRQEGGRRAEEPRFSRARRTH